MDTEKELIKVLQAPNLLKALIQLLDSINSANDLEGLRLAICQVNPNNDLGKVLDLYERALARWSNPQLPMGFQEKCPLLASRLDTPQKIRILLREADWRNLDPLLFGKVLENIIRQHEKKGKSQVSFYYKNVRGQWRTALEAMRPTEIWSLLALQSILWGMTEIGRSTKEVLFVGFASQE